MSGVRSFVIALGMIAAAAAAVVPHQARSQPTAKPYERVRVTPAPVPADAGLAAFRASLAGIAVRRVFAELAGNVVPHGFFWDSDFTGSFDSKKTGAENLAAAIRLEEGSGRGWQTLADFAAEPTATEIAALPGVICAPGAPAFSQDDFDRLVDTTRTTAADWVFPRIEGLELHAAPRSASAVAEKLGGHFVRILGFDTAPANADPLRTSWARIAAPSGQVGYVAPGGLSSPGAPQLCYVKDITGRWRIAGFVGGQAGR
jgi:hypothetical protein